MTSFFLTLSRQGFLRGALTAPSSTLNTNISASACRSTAINPSLQRSLHCAASRKNRCSKASRTTEICSQTRGKSYPKLSTTKTIRSRAAEQLRTSFFHDSIVHFFPLAGQAPQVSMRTGPPTQSAPGCADRRSIAIWMRRPALANFERLPRREFTLDFHKQTIYV